ncbi:type II toxin-antitoxin system PemK/MazF family toxin [Streptococcus mitis]|uniref:type II toxin-antitoxin system PemK/MazF family toxin n=1 Tax=Streptococcus mitis TaxID=28037 RepID=UPI0002E76E92|nr:type II toxin-antitoxin system PemK/MazF family toxin [Streptococcus mitis]
MKFQQGEVYLINFPQKSGNEFYGKHYAIILTPPDKADGTLLVAPLTGKNQERNIVVVSRLKIVNIKTLLPSQKLMLISEKSKK